MNNVFIIGVGLIGGSFALDIKQLYSKVAIFGIDKDETHLDDAIKRGVIDYKAQLKEVSKADLVILAIPV